MSDFIPPKAELRPFLLKPASGENATFTMTRFSPITDDFYFQDDALVILSPFEVLWQSPVLARSTKSLEEHIGYIQQNHIAKALVVAEDISFLRRCPSLRSLHIIPADTAEQFDYSPLCDLPDLQELNCQTVYGPKDSLHTQIDYSCFPKLHTICASGAKGHQNLSAPKGLRKLYLSQGQPACKSLEPFDLSGLQELSLCQSPLRTLSGLENARTLQTLSLCNCRTLEDISAIPQTVTSLEIDACGKIKDFSRLSSLANLEKLTLYGSNTLPDLSFLENMPHLRSFRFTVNVQDGDLTPCLRLKYAYCKNRKHYNLKDSDLPK